MDGARGFLFLVCFYLVEYSTILASEILLRKDVWVKHGLSAVTNSVLSLANMWLIKYIYI